MRYLFSFLFLFVLPVAAQENLRNVFDGGAKPVQSTPTVPANQDLPEIKPLGKQSNEEIEKFLMEVHRDQTDLTRRIEIISERFLGTPFRWGPLGEGGGSRFDSDPLMGFKSVDCVTAVEHILALAREKDLKKAHETLQKIRYKDGKIAYETRNHFPEADWIPNNMEAGYLTDITEKIAGKDVAFASKMIKKKEWYLQKTTSSFEGPNSGLFSEEDKLKFVEDWRKLGEEMQDVNVFLPYIPLNALGAHLDKIPSGAIISVVRKDIKSMPVLVSHQGFVIQKDGAVLFRHASSLDKKVVDVPLLDYFKKQAEVSKWVILGVNVTLPKAP